MHQTLDAPVYEINQESDFYKRMKWRKDQKGRINEILESIAEKVGFDVEEFHYYGSRGFGFEEKSISFYKFKDELTKNPDRNGLHTFKKSSKTFKIISPMMKEIDEINDHVSPFALHDILGLNNAAASQWIGDRLFVQARHSNLVETKMADERRAKQYPVEPIQDIAYTEYLQLFLESVKKDEENECREKV